MLHSTRISTARSLPRHRTIQQHLKAAAASPCRCRLTPDLCASRFWKAAGNPSCLPFAAGEPGLPSARPPALELGRGELFPMQVEWGCQQTPGGPSPSRLTSRWSSALPQKSCAGGARARTRGTCIIFDYYLWTNAVNRSQEDLKAKLCKWINLFLDKMQLVCSLLQAGTFFLSYAKDWLSLLSCFTTTVEEI